MRILKIYKILKAEILYCTLYQTLFLCCKLPINGGNNFGKLLMKEEKYTRPKILPSCKVQGNETSDFKAKYEKVLYARFDLGNFH